MSQIEFFDENVRVNLVPQITPRHADKKKEMTKVTHQNDRYGTKTNSEKVLS